MSAQPVTPVSGVPSYQPAEPRRSGPRLGTVILSLLAAALAGGGVGLVIALGGDGEKPGGNTASDAPVAAEPIEPASIESFDPVGGSGFRDKGGTWATQTYKSAEFGGLKPGAGLLIDLGEARGVSSVTLETANPGLAVELLAGDDPPSDDVSGLPSADSVTTGEGETVLSGAEGGEHRYWMVWVTKLAPAGGGFSATVSTPVVEGPPA
jgi:hypothetical protein